MQPQKRFPKCPMNDSDSTKVSRRAPADAIHLHPPAPLTEHRKAHFVVGEGGPDVARDVDIIVVVCECG